MPYFVFKINNHREFVPLASYENYREARNMVRTHRAGAEEEPGVVDYRMIFAENAAEGKRLLKTKKERTPSEDD